MERVLDLGQAIIVRSLQAISVAGLVAVGYGVYSLKVLRHQAIAAQSAAAAATPELEAASSLPPTIDGSNNSVGEKQLK